MFIDFLFVVDFEIKFFYIYKIVYQSQNTYFLKIRVNTNRRVVLEDFTFR